MIPITNGTQSTGNIFEYLGFCKAEAANLQVRALLALQIRDYIRSRKLTQNDAAKRFGVTQPDISAICNGRIGRIAIDKLVNMLARVGFTLSVSTKAGPRAFAVIEDSNRSRAGSRRAPIVQVR